MRPPSVDALAESVADIDLPHPLLVDAAREAIAAGDPTRVRAVAEARRRALLGPVVNGTGVLLHTNLGRAPVAHDQAATYTNLELDVARGGRGSRQDAVGGLVARACGAEAALVVNNGAAAVLLALAALAAGEGVAVSRGELVEIGGGFRIPEVMEQSGARLVEIGTTNRTRVSDLESALASAEVALALKVHRSNYRISGFTASVSVAETARVAAAAEVPVLVDLGSGLLDTRCPWLDGGPPAWLRGEPGVRQTLDAGADLVTFSGDKLFGGPQAGVLAGSRALVERCGRHPLARALRPGDLVLGALQATTLAYLRRDGDAIPFWRAATTPVEQLVRRAEAMGCGEPVATEAVAGGGTLPGVSIPSAGISLPGDWSAGLRAHDPPLIARVHDGATIVDLRTVAPHDDPVVRDAVTIAARARDRGGPPEPPRSHPEPGEA